MLTATAQHPLRVTGRGWAHAVDLEVGDVVVGADGRTGRVSLVVDHGDQPDQVVYNLSVDDLNTYVVLAGGEAPEAAAHGGWHQSDNKGQQGAIGVSKKHRPKDPNAKPTTGRAPRRPVRRFTRTSTRARTVVAEPDPSGVVPGRVHATSARTRRGRCGWARSARAW